MVAVDRLHHAQLSEDHRLTILGRPGHAMRRGLHLSNLCSDFGISFASNAMASAGVRSFRPSGKTIGSSKRRD